MSMFSIGPERSPRNDRAASTNLRGARSTRKAGGTQDSGQGAVSKEESKSRLRDAQRLMPMPRPSKSRPLPPGLEGQDRLMPPAGSFDRQAGQGLREGLGALVSFLNTPGEVVRGAVEGGAQAINSDFEMTDPSNAQIPGVNFIRDMMMGGGAQDGAMPLRRSFDPGTDALLRAYMRQMQGGQ